MVREFLCAQISRCLRELFTTAPWAALRLQPYAGSTILLELDHLRIPFRINPEGYPELAEALAESPQLTIRMPLSALPLLLADPASNLRHLHLEGNTGLASEVGFLAKNFRPDFEELLSRIVGDMWAYRMAGAARKAHHWAQDSLRRLTDSLAEYATEEALLLASRSSLQQFAQDVDQLNRATLHLEQRISRRT